MKSLALIAAAVLMAIAPAYAQMAPPQAETFRYVPVVYQAEHRSVVGIVKSYNSASGTLTLEDGTTYTVPNNPAQQMPSGLNSPPGVGQTVRITYFEQAGQRIVRDLEPESRGDTGERAR